jgi:hypothetical protein
MVAVTVNLASSIPAYYWRPDQQNEAAQYNYNPKEHDIPDYHSNLCGQVSVSMIYETITGKDETLGDVYQTLPQDIDSGTNSYELAAIAALTLPTGWKATGYAWGWVHEFEAGYEGNHLSRVRSTKLNDHWFAGGEKFVKNMFMEAIEKGFYLITGVYQATAGEAKLSQDGVGHWVVLRSFSYLKNTLMVKINNPFTNRIETYTWDEFWDCFAYWAVVIRPPWALPLGFEPPEGVQ